MILNIYKVKNGQDLYHLGKLGGTECGIPVVEISDRLERRKVGHDGQKNLPDPKPEELCPVCFKFLNK